MGSLTALAKRRRWEWMEPSIFFSASLFVGGEAPVCKPLEGVMARLSSYGRQIEQHPLQRLETLLRWMESVEMRPEMVALLEASIEDLHDITVRLLAEDLPVDSSGLQGPAEWRSMPPVVPTSEKAWATPTESVSAASLMGREPLRRSPTLRVSGQLPALLFETGAKQTAAPKVERERLESRRMSRESPELPGGDPIVVAQTEMIDAFSGSFLISQAEKPPTRQTTSLTQLEHEDDRQISQLLDASLFALMDR